VAAGGRELRLAFAVAREGLLVPAQTCLPFQVAIEVGGVETTIDIDPWTGAELLESDED
jgi:hypothetical protein